MRDQKKCGTCRYYDKKEGYCCQDTRYHHGYDGDDCKSWERVKGGYLINRPVKKEAEA